MHNIRKMADVNDLLGAVSNGIDGILGSVPSAVKSGAVAALGGAVVGSAVTGAIMASSSSSKSKSKKRRKKITHTKRGWKQDRARRSKQKWEVAYQRRKRKKAKSHSRRGRVRHTKNGQPYIILKSGKARFIKKKRR